MKPTVRDLSTLDLVRGAIVLGTLTYTDVDFPWVNCTFCPTADFATIKSLFDAELAAAEDEWEDLYTAIEDLGLQLINTERDQCIERFLLHIADREAWFRY